jgi:hypothetical protein
LQQATHAQARVGVRKVLLPRCYVKGPDVCPDKLRCMTIPMKEAEEKDRMNATFKA